jgi:Na+/H+-translocating membrane pyrophosphatase
MEEKLRTKSGKIFCQSQRFPTTQSQIADNKELKKMKRLSTLIVAIALPVALASTALAQEGKTLGTVVNGNTTTVFKAAGPGGLDTAKLKTWNDFAAAHPKVASDFAHKPALINDAAYAKRHPQLGAFFSAHPDIRDAMAANPGNYNAIPPRPGE